MGIANVVPQIGRLLQNPAGIPLLERLCECKQIPFDVPGEDAVSTQRIQAVFGHCIIPSAWQGIEGRFAVAVEVNKMPRRFLSESIPSFIRLDRMFAQIPNVLLVKPKHFGWKRKYRQAVNFLMAFESPGQENTRNTW
jgi:hypothetical protein